MIVGTSPRIANLRPSAGVYFDEKAGSVTYWVSISTVLEYLILKPRRKLPTQPLAWVPKHNQCLDLGKQVFGDLVSCGMHHSRTLRVANERKGLVRAQLALGNEAVDHVAGTADRTRDDGRARRVLQDIKQEHVVEKMYVVPGRGSLELRGVAR